MEICKANHDLECCRCNSGACENRKEFDSSGIEIRLYNHENGKSFYKMLTKDELIKISNVIEVE